MFIRSHVRLLVYSQIHGSIHISLLKARKPHTRRLSKDWYSQTALNCEVKQRTTPSPWTVLNFSHTVCLVCSKLTTSHKNILVLTVITTKTFCLSPEFCCIIELQRSNACNQTISAALPLFFCASRVPFHYNTDIKGCKKLSLFLLL